MHRYYKDKKSINDLLFDITTITSDMKSATVHGYGQQSTA